MKFSILGLDRDTLALAQAAINLGHAVIAVAEASEPLLTELRALAPRVEVLDDWQSLIGREATMAVVVGRATHDDARTEQLRQLFQAGVPLLVAHPVVASMLTYYELDMYRQESACLVQPCVPAVWHPAIARLCVWLQAGESSPLWRVEQVIVERSLAERDRQTVLTHFVRDLELLRLLCGELNKVGAMTSPTVGAERDYSALGVQLAGPSGILARWNVGPATEQADDQPGARLTVIGATGKAIVQMSTGDNPWQMELRAAGQSSSETFADWSAPEAVIAQFAVALEREVARPTGARSTGAQPTWLDACRDLELADALERSLQRGRTIDLHFEEHTEQGTFKGLMAAGGCLLLMLTLVVLFVAAVFGGFNIRGAEYWPYLLVAALGLFLALQGLRLVFPKGEKP